MNEDGDGYGNGYEDGNGYGDGYGNGYGEGDGYGYGGSIVGVVGDFEIVALMPWHYLRAGCECHSHDVWRRNWQQLAAKHGFSVQKSEKEKIISSLDPDSESEGLCDE